MNHLIVIRHGERRPNAGLTDTGKKQMRTAAESIRDILKSGTNYFLCSLAPRAVDSTMIIMDYLELPVEFEAHNYLWSANDAPREGYLNGRDVRKLRSFIEERASKADNLIVVSHREPVTDLGRVLAQDIMPPMFEYVNYGCGFHLYKKSGKYRAIP